MEGGDVLEEEFPTGQSNTESADSRELLEVQLPLQREYRGCKCLLWDHPQTRGPLRRWKEEEKEGLIGSDLAPEADPQAVVTAPPDMLIFPLSMASVCACFLDA